MNPELTPRQQSIDRLEKELAKAAKSQRFVNSDEGSYVIEYIGELISSITNNIVNKQQDHLQYVKLQGQAEILIKLKRVLETQANEQVIAQIHQQLDLAKSEDV